MYIDVGEASNSIKFSVRTPYNSVGMHQCHTVPLSLYTPIPYLQTSDHSVLVRDVSNILFIGTPFSVTNLRIFIQGWKSFLCQYWRHCGTHFLPHFQELAQSGQEVLCMGNDICGMI